MSQMSDIYKPKGFVKVTTPCQSNPELFFDQYRIQEAKKVCSSCPFKQACLETAEYYGKGVTGVWGGKYFASREVRTPKTETPFCLKGLHPLPEIRENNRCRQCYLERKRRRKDTPAGKAKVAREIARRSAKKKNRIGGTCRSGKHLLTEENTQIRTHDQALMCKDCLQSLARVRFKNDTGTRDGRENSSVWKS